ncbi:hypothetical protein PG993_002705 [Apiospora rasikravindrae]|uniref:DNA damage-inducible protein 1 n=1 Tax=Apiospora rasikravindrae TaxID=990691 RepID=A0ABR1TZL9_9PEZI
MTLGALRSSIEAEGIPAPSQHIYHNGQLITDASKTLQELQISDGDMLALHVRDMRGNTGVAQPPPQQQPQQQQQRQQQQAAAQQDPELVRLQFLGDPRLQAELRRRNPQIADALNDATRFAQLMRQGNDSQEDERRQRMREIEQLNRDEFNPDAQARIEEMIRQQNVMENLQNAMEYNPESFGRVHLLYIDVKVNGTKVKALVDSGAQATIMSPSCAEACNIMHLVDRRFAGIARGVGTANIIGRVHYTMLQLGSRYLPAAFTVMEGKSVDLLLGLDILKGHQATIDLSRNKLIIQGEEVEFLGESDIPRETEAALNEEPTSQVRRLQLVLRPQLRLRAQLQLLHQRLHLAPAHLLQGQHQHLAHKHQARPCLCPPPQRQPQQFPEDKIEKLMALGVNREDAINALEATDGNVEYAAGLLFQNL